MKKNRRGFTLVELLAVIVILAIIALIAVPVIINIISSARKNAFEDTAYGLIKAGEMYYASNLLNGGMSSDKIFTFTEGGEIPEGLNVKGEMPKSGKIKVTKEGKVSIAITNGDLCIKKSYEDSKIQVLEDYEACELPPEPGTLAYLARTNEFASSIAACATRGNCEPGTQFAIEVAPGNTQNFYVVSDVDNKVTLIMDSNVEGFTPWIRKSDYIAAGGTEAEWDVQYDESGNNNKGPITALNYLESQTNSWTNIPTKNYTYEDAAYGKITKTDVRARMITYDEVNNLGCSMQQNACPAWVYDKLSSGNGIYGYWTSSADSSIKINAWYVMFFGYVSSEVANPENYCGVRPVIELSK